MESKRKSFPRFYFLSNDELIDILAHQEDLDVVLKHLRACFFNIVDLTIGDIDADATIDSGFNDEPCLKSMHSAEGEEVPFRKAVKTKEVIEKCQDQLQKAMRETLYQLLMKFLLDYANQERDQFLHGHYGQIVAEIGQIMFCSTTEDHLNDV